MTDDRVRKVTALLTRRSATDLLVFQHPVAGLQLPAGTVEPGEEPAEAFIREVREETNLRVTSPAHHLGMWPNELAETERITRHVVPLLAQPDPAAPQLAQIGRGVTVPAFEQTAEFVQVAYDTVDNDSSVTLRGWIDARAVGRTKERHFFHATIDEPTPDRWSLVADQDLTFECYWTPLDPKPCLVKGQDVWLDFALPFIQPTAT